jgi:hypothetical protein
MSFQTYLDSKKVLLEDPPYYAVIAAAQLVADADSKRRIERAWGHELRSPGRAFDLKYGIWLVDQNPTFTLESYLFAAIVNADTTNMMHFEHQFPAILHERKARYHAPGGRLPHDPPQAEE